MARTGHRPACRRLVESAFTLIEILVVIALLSFIIVGLLAMFLQVQRAFKVGMTQTDVLESGRVVTEMIQRDLSQITPAYQYRNFNNDPNRPVVNFLVFLRDYKPMEQPLPGTATPVIFRTNLLEDMFFLRHENQTWYGVGYYVRTNDPSGNLDFPQTAGTLYRFETNYTDVQFRQNPDYFYRDYIAALTRESRANKILDGVVHFKVRAFDTNGVWLTQNLLNNVNFNKSDIRPPNFAQFAAGEVERYWFYSNAVPASVEFELGILEARTLERVKALPDAAARRQYLEDPARGVVGRLHLFRQRVPIRNVDPTAYQ